MRKTFIGRVISTKMQKTVSVEVERKFRHPVYQKVITRHKKYLAHNENLDIKIGDLVIIEEGRPISKNKHFIVIGKVTKK